MIKLKWMEKPTELKGDVLRSIQDMENPGVIVAAYAQNDTWDVHVFVIYREAGKYQAEMFHFQKESREQEEFEDDLFCEAVTNGLDDSEEYNTLEETIDAINENY